MKVSDHGNEYFLHRFKEGDEPAFEMVFKSDYNRIVGFCHHFVKDSDKAQSLAQESFVNLWINRQKIQSYNGIRSFLYTSAKTLCLNFLRHNKVVSNYQNSHIQLKELEISQETLTSFNFDELEVNELEKLIEDSVNNLPERCRMVFLLSRNEGKKNSDIAEELGISVKSVEANMTRALKILRVKLADYLPAILVHLILKSF